MIAEVKTGVTSKGGDVNWNAIEERRVDNPRITILSKEGENLIKEFCNRESNEEKIADIKNEKFSLNMFIENFNSFLKEKKIKFSFEILENPESDIDIKEKSKSSKKGKKVKELSSAEKIRLKNFEDKQIEKIKIFLNSLNIINHLPCSTKNPTESFFNIIYWTLYLIKNKSKEIDNAIFLDCAISLYRAIEDSKYFLYDSMIIKSEELLNELENSIKSKISLNNIFKMISDENKIISNCYWDKEKPISIRLYDEQKRVLIKIMDSLMNNEPLLYFYKVPPSNGKTLLSIILAKGISYINNLKRESIGYKKKILLYLCPSSIVRDEVAVLCVGVNIDIKFWLAIQRMDKIDGKIKTIVRPHDSCYPNFKNREY